MRSRYSQVQKCIYSPFQIDVPHHNLIYTASCAHGSPSLKSPQKNPNYDSSATRYRLGKKTDCHQNVCWMQLAWGWMGYIYICMYVYKGTSLCIYLYANLDRRKFTSSNSPFQVDSESKHTMGQYVNALIPHWFIIYVSLTIDKQTCVSFCYQNEITRK